MVDAAASNVVGVDVGGTFTDVVLRGPDGGLTVLKVPSTPQDQSRGILEGLEALEVPATDVGLVIHGTTVATNAVIERKGARCLLVTTRGFRDVLELGRRDRPQVYGLRGTANPLIPRDRRVEVDERVRSDGTVERPLSADELLATVEPHMSEVDAVVVSFVHAYRNPVHEDMAQEVIRERWPDLYIIAAARALPRIGEFERTSTASVHAFVQPVMSRYLTRLARGVRDAGYPRAPAIIQSNGGVMALTQAVERPGNTVRSGPAAGVIAAAAVARSAGHERAITVDMGGTSFDAALVVDGQPTLTDEKLVDFRIPLRTSTIDVETIGAGGGSLATLDASGILRVGPESAGSEPGPACYGRGGLLPTVTDANVVLGRINARRPIGGDRLALDASLSRQAVRDHVATPLRLSVEDAAEAIIRVVDARMAGQVRIQSVGRGHDPRDFVLVAFGGAGPLHGDAIAREVGIPTVIVPPAPGVTSAIGCIEADVQYDFVQSFRERVDALDLAAVDKLVLEVATEGDRLIAESGVAVEATDVHVVAEMHYEGQRHAIQVPVATPLEVGTVTQAFRTAYRRRYGAPLDVPAVLVDLTVHVVGRRAPVVAPAREVAASAWDDAASGTTPVYFDGGWTDAVVLERDAMTPGMHGTGPALVEQADTTVLVRPDSRVTVDGVGNLHLEAH